MKQSEYDTMYRVEDVHWWYRALRALVRWTWRTYAQTQSGAILDIGCGTGANLAMFGEETEATGVDFSEAALKRCRERGLTRLAQADAGSLPFASDAFDGVLMMDVLYHRDVSDVGGALSEAKRILSPGGVLLANVPAYRWLYSTHDEAIHTGHRFTRSELVSLLRSAGLEPIRATYWNSVLFPAIALLRLWRRQSTHEGSDLAGYEENLRARLLGGILALERAALRVGNLPFGLSIFAVARKPAA